jgi:hypothetical protein
MIFESTLANQRQMVDRAFYLTLEERRPPQTQLRGAKIGTTMRRLSAALSICTLLLSGSAHGEQTFRYIARATAAALDNGAVTGDVGAGGTTPKGQVIEDKICDASVVSCFDETKTAGAIPDLLLTGTASVVGGAQTAAGAPNPGFPRVESTAQASLVLLAGLISIAITPTRAIADGQTGELTATGGPIILELAGTPITLPAGEGIELPGLLTLLASQTKRSVKDGLAVIEIAGAIINPDPNGPLAPLGPIILGRAIAGIEVPFVQGGGGGGACALAKDPHPSDGWELTAVVGLLWLIVRRRRQATN